MHCYLHMSDLVDIVDSLENKISKLLHKLDLLQRENINLQKEIADVENEKTDTKNTLVVWEEKYNSLKLANSMLGSNTNKTEAKLKINTLIRELDHCIAQLSE
jgi:chromosome segregation ATPase